MQAQPIFHSQLPQVDRPSEKSPLTAQTVESELARTARVTPRKSVTLKCFTGKSQGGLLALIVLIALSIAGALTTIFLPLINVDKKISLYVTGGVVAMLIVTLIIAFLHRASLQNAITRIENLEEDGALLGAKDYRRCE